MAFKKLQAAGGSPANFMIRLAVGSVFLLEGVKKFLFAGDPAGLPASAFRSQSSRRRLSGRLRPSVACCCFWGSSPDWRLFP